MKKKYRIACICQIYNELCKNNLERFVKYVLPAVDDLVVYDDGSTDGSYEYMLKQTPYVLRGTKNDFVNERSHKQLLLQEALKLNPDFILWLDADEVLTANAAEKLQELCAQCEGNNYDAVIMHEINLWRSGTWQRLDSLYDKGWFCRLWRVVPGICFHDTKPGLHQPLFPSTIRNVMWTLDVQVLHFGFSSKQRLAHKYLVYRSHGQRGYDMLDRLISEEKLVVSKVPPDFFPEGLWSDDDEPIPLTFAESLAYVEEYKEEVFKPRFSIVCLVYKSVEWLKFVYEQVYRYTDMTDKEFFFVANDATPAVLNYLRDNYIPHYAFTNTPEQQQEWYVNNVYRAYNFAASKAQGDFVLFINSDMAFTPGWFDNLWKAYNGENCVASRLVESGKLRSGQYGVEKDFGRDYSTYREIEFQQYAREISEPQLVDGGLFMPLLIRKEHFEHVGGYPEGQVLLGSDFNHPVIAKRGEACISGDTVLILKLKTIGIKHQTAFDSLAYHFQWGELDSPETLRYDQNDIKVAICCDSIAGSIGERLFWNSLEESLPASVSIGRDTVGDLGDYAANARKYIQHNYPGVEVILQNATFINIVDQSRYTIAVLQDNLRSMGISNAQQEENLRQADKLVTNSCQTALAYPEFDFEIISGGLGLKLFKKMNKEEVRQEFCFGSERIGIYIGDFNEVHGWGKVRACIAAHPEITWIIVTKNIEPFIADNVRIFYQVPRNLLVKLLNCADFLVNGSPLELQSQGAIEACLCDVPVIMRKIGFFKDLSPKERDQCGIFGEDIEGAIQGLSKRSFTPRNVLLEKTMCTPDSTQKWESLIETVFKDLMIEKSNIEPDVKRPKVSIVITTYQRTHLLRWGLYSLSLQTMPYEFETIVVNDGIQDQTEEICKEFKEKLHLKYIFTGQRNLQGEPIWRVPGFAINIGVKQASGDILVMCCAEMLHVNQTIEKITMPILGNPKLLGIPVGKDDRTGALLESIEKNNGSFEQETFNNCIDLDTRMPFLMALHRSQFLEIGGYDEDFTGIAYDDRDFIDRILAYGCQYCRTEAVTAHLYHPRAEGYYQGGGPPEWDYNKNLYFSRRGKIVRNEGRAWGKL
ncbi:glycosyltransferase [Desulfosporosinus meridiei]|uniref:Glycosyl transferase n=1 Tax=Desulfosporosinus meridiei (strain ATCC BAA-275 / DSM 13257 / KCTC 12902 / NCIMB 13706 / S10) TaxID=768704 RepID=J7IKU8_DESMD|nr:glycosyltransferase [Desulfosporosinus meridiei]AFQ42397.1 glycosyl transferase [Desulfosporosinus meridiei DSM 13257]